MIQVDRFRFINLKMGFAARWHSDKRIGLIGKEKSTARRIAAQPTLMPIPKAGERKKSRFIFLCLSLVISLSLTGCASLNPNGADGTNPIYSFQQGVQELILDCSIATPAAATESEEPLQEIGSEQDLFFFLQDALYSFKTEASFRIESYDLFLQYWKELESEGALHSAFQTGDVSVIYDSLTPCTVNLSFAYDPAGLIMSALRTEQTPSFADSETKKLYGACQSILSQIITNDMTDLEKEIAIHDYIVIHTEYQETGDMTELSQASSVLLNGKGQCQGYAEAVSLLLAMEGIESRVISGVAYNSDNIGTGHAWNQVLLDGTWYHVDATWDDPVPDTGNYASRDYLNRSDAFFALDHSWSGLFPSCPTDMATQSSDQPQIFEP